MIMGNIHLITGYAGYEHVTASDHGSFNTALFGNGQFVIGKGNQFAASVITNNKIRVLDGDIYMQGRYIRLQEDIYVDLDIENGEQGYLRNDLIVARYTKDTTTGVEDCNLVVIKGLHVTSNPSDPEYTTGDIINDHALQNDMPLYRVPLNGIDVGQLVPLFTVKKANFYDMADDLKTKQTKTDQLTTETSLSDGDSIPFYDVSESAHRKTPWSNIKSILANLFAAKDHTHTPSSIGASASGHTHTLESLGAAASSHKHSASDINSGILSVARGGTGVSSLSELAIVLGGSKIVTGSYTGTGKYGSSNPNSLTFDFELKFLWIFGWKNKGTYASDKSITPSIVVSSNAVKTFPYIDCSLLTTDYKGNMGLWYLDNNNTSSDNCKSKISEDRKTIYWYCGINNTVQFNQSSYEYYYIAIG